MIKTLQRKFIVTAMTAISALLLLLLGTINILNIYYVGNQLDKKLEMISQNEGNPDNIPMAPGDMPPREPYGMKNDYDTFMSSNFFVVRFDRNGDIVYSDVSRISSVSEEDAKELAEKIYAQNDLSGKIDSFEYMVRDSRMGFGKVVVFLDTSGDIYSYIRVLFLSAAIGIACWLLMLLFVILLSKRAIRPIAENVEKQKQFVTNAGHEIKTPIAIIQSNTEAMELYNGENKWSKNIKEQTVRINELMKNLLTLARMDESSANLIQSEFSLSQLLTDHIECFRETLKLRGITLQTSIQPMISFRANKEHITQLISVLMDNAVKYTNEGGNVFVSLEGNDKRIKLQFKNTCQQLPPVPPEKLFDRFYRADEARTQKNGGYGIGLSVAQSITETYKGRITAEYENGNTIIFTIRF
ncbi:sensor histidine kinase [Mediterraneibacter agrestimuris]|uniref:sensor histidine kinase n=1 Tax=Mediterraneibacter agrestimuris TaxID=2941333 RepID=UPI00203EA2E5|nr:HAMP domain-containing sensor histidine kinase [Mediterraneibacter agrestimuris]